MTNIILAQCTNKPLPFDDSAIPIQLLSVAGTLKERGFKVQVFDLRKNPTEQIDKCDLVAVNVTTGQSITQGLMLSHMLKMVDDIKVPIVWTGIHPSVLPEQTVKSKLVDYAIVGDADLALPELALRLEAGEENLPKIWNSPCEDLDALPFVPFDLIDLHQYSDGAGMPILTSRGCPHACAFCTNRAVNQGHWRTMSPQRIVEHIQHYKDKYKIRDFKFFDDNFCADLDRVKETSQLILKEKCDIDWNTSCRVDYVKDMSPQLLELMKKAGLWNLAFGFESGSQRMLDLINKHITVNEIKDAAKKLSENHIPFGGTFVFGFPTETIKDVFETLHLNTQLSRISKDFTSEFYQYVPCPGTALFETAVKNGFKEPKTLEEWAKVDFTYKPWLTREHRKLIDGTIYFKDLLINIKRRLF